MFLYILINSIQDLYVLVFSHEGVSLKLLLLDPHSQITLCSLLPQLVQLHCISLHDFYLDLEDMKDIDDKEIIARADAQAWNPETDEFISIHDIDTDLKQEVGEYTVTFSTNNKTSITRKIWVVDQRVVENKKANEAVSAFNFFKTVDEIKESMAIDTDLKTWANAQGWKLDDENETVDLDVDYDFDPETITEGVYKVTFWTTGREFKIHTTDYVEEGKEVGLTFFAEDIHVMEKMGF